MNIVSIVIPCWNAGKYLPELLESLRAQTFTDWQAFLVDDLSEDNTCEVIKSFQAVDNRFVMIRRDRGPKGAQTCRNIGLSYSTGYKYVCIFDADDILKDYCLAQRVDFMEKHPDLDFSVFPAECFYDGDIDKKGPGRWGNNIYSDDIKAVIDGTIPMVGWTNIYKVQSIIDNNLSWDESLLSLQDSDWNFHALICGLTYRYASTEGAQADYLYRIGQTNNVAGKLFDDKHLLNHLMMLGKWRKMLGWRLYKKYRLPLRARAMDYLMSYMNKNTLNVGSLKYLHVDKVFFIKGLVLVIFQNRGFKRLFKSEITYRQNGFKMK